LIQKTGPSEALSAEIKAFLLAEGKRREELGLPGRIA